MATSKLFTTIEKAFEEEGWAFSTVPGREVIRAGFEGSQTRIALHVQSFPELPAVSVVSESVTTTDSPAKRERLAELIMRVNQTLTVGNFEMDWDAGRVIFRVTNLFSSPEGDLRIIKGLIHNTVGEMDRIARLEMMIHRAEGTELAGIDIARLLGREDMLPDVPLPEQGGNR